MINVPKYEDDPKLVKILCFLKKLFSFMLLMKSYICSRVSAVASDRVSSETSHSIVSVIQFELIQFLLLVRCPLEDVCLAGLIRLNETQQLIEHNNTTRKFS
jgi:hypothetical protein